MPSAYVRVPKDKFAIYWHKPWQEVVHAAESNEDDLCCEGPTATPWPWTDGGPQREHFIAGPSGDLQFAEKQAKYERGKNAAYLRECDGARGKNKSCLFQQNW